MDTKSEAKDGSAAWIGVRTRYTAKAGADGVLWWRPPLETRMTRIDHDDKNDLIELTISS